jgi:hypothetical protein
MVLIGQGLRNYAGRLGRASYAALGSIRSAEKKINYLDKYYTGGVAGEIYKASPLYSTIQPIRQASKTFLGITGKLGSGIAEGNLKSVSSAAGELGDIYDRETGGQIFKNIRRNPIAQRIYNSPFIQSGLL